ncbi:MAG: hypothetical protein Q9185_003542 [Variospora sp. 1 TL-2023]
MDGARERLAEVVASLEGKDGAFNSRATSPGLGLSRETNTANESMERNRPRTFPYFRYLPYEIENEAQRQKNFEDILKHLYIAVEAGDFAPGALHWTREIRNWMGLKFDPTKEQRIRLVKLFYELALAPGLDVTASERFSNMFMVLTKRKHYLRPGVDLTLDWRPLYRELKVLVLPSEGGMLHTTNVRRNVRTLTKLCTFAQLYFDPEAIPAILEELLPHFSASFAEGGFVVVGLLNLLFPTAPALSGREEILPQRYLPAMFHLWSLMNRSRIFDTAFLDLLSRLARDSLVSANIAFSECGIYTQEQTSLIFTAILRMLDIPVGQATSPYSSSVDVSAGLAVMLERDTKKHPIAHHIARWIVMSLSPACLNSAASVLHKLEGLIQAVETFFHPSNSGGWTKTLHQLVYYLADFFVMRWNREKSGELEMPDERKLDDPLKRRFVLCLREVVFMGIYSKSGTAMNFALSTLQSLAYLEPELILPGALQRIYPSMQGLVEVHRTTSSLRALQVLSRIMVRTKGFRCHVTTMLGLALPGIDANDLEKTLYTLSYIQSVCYSVPLHDLTEGRDDVSGSMLASQWIGSEVERMEHEGINVELDYRNGLDEKTEELILRSSTSTLAEFVSAFLGKVFTLLENLPDAARVRSGSPEENVINTLPATFTPLLASLSPDLYNMALNKVADFIGNHVIHQARDAMAFICSALCKVNPTKALRRLIPVLISSIRTEIDENGAASTRNTGTDVLPRDRGLVWSISMLSMCVVHVGDAVLEQKQELFDIANYMQRKCKGIPTVHVSNFVHHLLLNLTGTYTVDYALYEKDVYARGLCPTDWGMIPDPKSLNIAWHVPSRKEVEFAVELFKSQGEGAVQELTALTSGTSHIKRDGTGKEWSDEVSRNLVLVRLLLSGVSVLFDAEAASKEPAATGDDAMDVPMEAVGGHASEEQDTDASVVEAEENEKKPTYKYPAGYVLTDTDPLYHELHHLRKRFGELLHAVHDFLTHKQEDDIACFGPLYTAYRSWFIDVGIERSAHVLDRVTRLLFADIHPYKLSGLRKEYPRPLLLRRANLYHLQRLRHNSYPRGKTRLTETLLLDLAQSSMSSYTEVRRNAQSAGEAALKAIIGARPLVIPSLLQAFENGVKHNDFALIKGGIYSLIFGSLSKTIGRDWRFTPRVIKAFISASTADKPSVQKLCSTATLQIMDFGRPLERMIILDKQIVRSFAPSEDVTDKIDSQKAKVLRKRRNVETKMAALSDDLVELAKISHWKKASRTAAIVITLGLRFESIASTKMIDLMVKGVNDTHPGLRGLYGGAMVALFSLINSRASAQHKYENFITDQVHLPAKIQVQTEQDDPEWTSRYLASFAHPEAEYYVDHDHPGWLVWDKTMPAYKANPKTDIEYDGVEQEALNHIGQLLDRQWFSVLFDYFKQEPRDAGSDRFRVTNAMLLQYAFQLVHREATVASFAEIQTEIARIFGDGTDKHQHRAAAEIFGALLISTADKPVALRSRIWEYVFPTVQKVFADGLTPENSSYWVTFLHMILQGNDPRRAWPLVESLALFRLDMSSNAAFKESSKIQLLQQCVTDLGWHFQLEKPVIDDFLAHLDHPYKGVREAMGTTLASLYRTRYHESYKDVETFVTSQREASSIGSPPYQPSEEFSQTIHGIFERLEHWRHERAPGQQTPSSYTSGGKTVLLWLDSALSSFECTEFLSFFPNVFVEQLLHMMDVKEDQELQGLAYHVFRHIPNIPHRLGEDTELIASLIRIGTQSPLWHQRLRVLINMQVIFFRRLFLLPHEQQQNLYDCVATMLEDSQLEVRLGASSTLSGMIRCSPIEMRTRMIEKLKQQFTQMLDDSPLPKKAKGNLSARSTGTNTPTPEHSKLVLSRHAAVLGLGALVQAFPYTSPPPSWIPGVLTTLANKANNDPGMVGKSVKSILSDFKKTRQDTWQMDLKAFTQEQAEDLDGVLWRFLRTSQHSKTIPRHVMAASEHAAQAEQGVPLRSQKDLGKCFIGSIDQGTTSTRFMIFNGHGVPVASHQVEFKQIYPQSGWVEQDPREIAESVFTCIEEATKSFTGQGHSTHDIKAVGITSQRETTVLWDRDTGEPLYNAIAWPDTRTQGIVRELKGRQAADSLQSICGLPLSTYPSALKLTWLFRNVKEVQQVYDAGHLMFGTIDTWLLYCLNGGKDKNVHITDSTNASRTMFVNLHTLEYSPEVLDFFELDPKKILLPRIVPCSDPEAFGSLASGILKGKKITGCIGDQSAALVGQLGFEPGMAKNTYGTGCFLLYNVGEKPVMSSHGLLTTVAYNFGGKRKPVYALEGSIAVAGSAVKYVVNNLKFVDSSAKISDCAATVKDNGGCYFVTAFSGLFAPYWIDDARGTMFGITQYTQQGHIARAAMEATCFQTKAILDAMEKDSGHKLTELAVDGGMTDSDLCMQTQADIINIPVDRPVMRETTALGAAIVAGFAVDVWKEFEELKEINKEDRTVFKPQISQEESGKMYNRWSKAVEMSKGWLDSDNEPQPQ